ncbi:MAG: hypothetical protein ACLP1X_21230 [Polyangiaceae bacterium]|jgi:hypothetical protein
MHPSARTHGPKLLGRAIPVLPATLLLASACDQSSSHPEAPLASEDQTDAGPTSGFDSSSSSGGGTASSNDTGTGTGSDDATAAGSGSGGIVNEGGSVGSSGASGSSGGAGAGDAGTDAGAVCVTSAAMGSCGPYLYPAITGSDGSNTTVGQDVWNPISGWSQTLHATNPGNWYATANLPADNTAVVSYPNTGESYDSNLLTGFSSIYSSFSETMNPTAATRAEAAYDIWLNNWNNEVMVQHDMVNRGGPCGPVLATVSFGGNGGVPVQSWILCQYGSELIWQVAGSGDVYGEQSGSVDILAMLTWLVNNDGYLPQGSSLTAIGYGFEICSTGGADETFQVKSFTLTSSP